jgi:tetratricopeptide (TPR) repeat protein
MEEKGREAEMDSTLDYFSLLGVSKDASQDEIEARYRELSDHLASDAIPDTLRAWADREAALIDEAYAILSDQERRAEFEQAFAQAPQAAPAGPVETQAVPAVDALGPAEERPVPASSRTASREQPVSALNALLVGVPWKLMALGGVIGLVVLGAAFFGNGLVPGLGGGDDDSQVAETETGLAPIDTERVAELMTLVQEDPKNAEATFELGEIFFLGGEWQAGIDWFTKLLELDPTNVHALTDVGTANFNLGSYDASKAAWLKALEIDPNDVQVHYNMGFFYSNVDPVDIPAALNEWQLVTEIAPGSDLASTAQVHLESLAASPEASPAATEAPAGS